MDCFTYGGFRRIAWWKILIGFFVMHYTAGMILSLVFQLAHIVPNTEMPVPDKDGNLEHTWAVHQLYTTSNFAPTNWTGKLLYRRFKSIKLNIIFFHIFLMFIIKNWLKL